MERRGYSRGWVCQACDASNAATATACATCTLQRGAAKPTPARAGTIDRDRLAWRSMRASKYVEDRRGQHTAGSSAAAGPRGAQLGVGVLVVLGVLAVITGVDPQTVLQGAQMLAQQAQAQSRAPGSAAGQGHSAQPEDEVGSFVARILGETETVWRRTLASQLGVRYQEPTLVMFAGSTRSACGFAKSAMGPFYCPRDRKIYLDTSFFDDMRRKYGGGGNLAFAYVVAHEVAHHVEKLLGVLDRLDQAALRGPAARNAASVQVELAADCLAGVWAGEMQSHRHNLDEADVAAAIGAASAMGDDRLQMQAQGYVVPDSFTHGSAQQRVQSFMLGFRSRDVMRCIDSATHG